MGTVYPKEVIEMTTKLLGLVNGDSFGFPNRRLELEIDVEIKDPEVKPALSISASVWEPEELERSDDEDRDIVQGGQIQDEIRELVAKGAFASKDISLEDLVRLLDIWDEWHLNDTTAGCEHQLRQIKRSGWKKESLTYSRLISLPQFKKCPECGYSYGSSWLYRQIPKDVIQFINRILKQLPDFKDNRMRGC